jgi:RimK family alpha-L-glutamate ligase
LQYLTTRLGGNQDFKIVTQAGAVLSDMDGIIVRGVGSATVPYPKIFFRIDTLYALERLGVVVLNTPRSIEYATDKYFTSLILAQHGIPTPRTYVVENFTAACAAFDDMGGDVVVKPIYGAMGIGIMRVSDRGFAERVFMKLEELNEVFYLQEFVEHQNRDIRVVTIGGEVVAAMYRVGTNWKTNIHAGAQPQAIDLPPEMAELAIRSAEVTEVEVCGVDILETPKGPSVIEVNSIPGWKGLQQVVSVDVPAMVVDYLLNKIG